MSKIKQEIPSPSKINITDFGKEELFFRIESDSQLKGSLQLILEMNGPEEVIDEIDKHFEYNKSQKDYAFDNPTFLN